MPLLQLCRGLLVTICVMVAAMTIGVSAVAAADLSYYLPAGVKYSKSIATPRQFLGFEIGDRHIQHHQLVSYAELLAKQSPRVSLQRYAQTHGGRPLILLTISHPDNLQSWRRIQTRHRRLAEPGSADSVPLDDLPAVINMGYSVHGNEASAGNAAALVIYHLAAAEGDAIDQLLKEVVVLLDPCLNPEGFDRFAHWVNSNRGRLASADPAHREHVEAWPNGRTNYYWFDLNRDWLPLQHPESQGRLTWYHRVKPNVVLDFHEMGSGSTFFFQPGVPTRNHPLTPPRTFQLTRQMAAYHARALDRVGSQYYTEERFDDFYMGKGSTYPDLHGAVGILFEQGSARGHRQQTSNGLLSFSFAIRNQFLCSLSSLRATQDMRIVLHEHKRDFYRESLQDARAGKTRGFVLTAPHDRARLHEFARILKQHDIDVFRLRQTLKIKGETYPAGDSIVVPMEQPEYRFLLSLLERRTKFQENVFYDVSTWTLPLAFDLQYDELTELPPVEHWEELWPSRLPSQLAAFHEDDLAYIIDWRGYFAARVLSRLLEEDVIVKVARDSFGLEVEGKTLTFGHGTLVIPLGIQPRRAAAIRRILRASSQQDGVRIYGVGNGLTPKGIDLGSDRLVRVRRPKILLLVGSGVRAYEAGEVWHLLDHRFGIPMTMAETSRLGSLRLSDYTNVILVTGSYQSIGKTDIQRIKSWVEEGGTLVSIGTAAQWLKSSEVAPVPLVSVAATPTTSERLPYAGRSNRSALQLISGAIFATSVDTTHPLGYGFAIDRSGAPWATLPVFRNNRVILQKRDSSRSSPVVYQSGSLMSGYVSDRNQQYLNGSASVWVHSMGRGHVVVLAENPNFRAFWYGTNRLFLNSLFFANTIR